MKKLFIPILFLLFFSCSNDDSGEFPKVIESTLIGKSSLYGNGAEGINESNQVITNNTNWQNLINQIDSSNNMSSNFTEININFEEYIVLAVFDQIRGSGGNSIFINQIIENDDTIVVDVENLQTGMSTVITQPFYIAKIPKTDKPIIFE